MWEKVQQLKKWIIQQIIKAEKELKGKSGAEKKAAVVKIIDEMIKLPAYMEWADNIIISWLVDLACEKLNMLTDRKIDELEATEEEAEKLTAVLDAPVSEVVKSGMSVDERLNALYKQYGIKADEPKPIATGDDFERAIVFSLKWEGGRNFEVIGGIPVIKGKSVNDRGGLTAYGITNSTLKYAHASGVVAHGDIVKLTQEEAKKIYKKNFWQRYGWGDVTYPVSLCCMDSSIHHGGFAWILQRALVSVGYVVKIDGKYGNQTRTALIKAASPKLARAICDCRKDYMDKVIAKDPDQINNRDGWYNRVEALRKAAGV